MIQPVVRPITGIKFFPREYADSRESDEIKLAFLLAGGRVWTQASIYGFILEIVVREPAVTRGVLLRIDVPFRVERAEVRRLVRGKDGLGVPNVDPTIFPDCKIEWGPPLLFPM